jgi:midasin (ATPase involved in ribosome maturation)
LLLCNEFKFSSKNKIHIVWIIINQNTWEEVFRLKYLNNCTIEIIKNYLLYMCKFIIKNEKIKNQITTVYVPHSDYKLLHTFLSTSTEEKVFEMIDSVKNYF